MAKNPDPPRAWQRMLSGRRLDLLNPSPLDIEIDDIAHGLARVARWNGQTSGEHAFSVAQHSLLVEAIFSRRNPKATPEQQLIALLHDAPEYVIGDMISPFKTVIGGSYKSIEEGLLAAIHLRFALPTKPPESVRKAIKRADHVAAFYEATTLAGFEVNEAREFFGWPEEPVESFMDMEPMPVRAVQDSYIRRFSEIENERVKKNFERTLPASI